MGAGGENPNVKMGDRDGMTKITDVKLIDFNDKAAIQKAIDDFAEKYAYADVEHALEISPNGNVYTLKGTKGNVNAEILGKDILKGSISIHNHTLQKGEIMGDSFSKRDLAFAAEYKLGKQYLISGKRRDAFEYNGNLGYNNMIKKYNEAFTKVRELAWNADTEIIFESEQVLKILRKSLKGFAFYENI